MASSIPSHILIFGATGAIGKYITQAVLSAKPAFKHVTIFTSPGTTPAKTGLLQKWKSATTTVTVGDVNNESDVVKAFTDGSPDTVISCLGRGALQAQIKLVELAEASESVKWFFPSEYGTDIEYGPKSATEKMHQTKLAVRKYIRENTKKLKITYLVTGPYFDMWVDIRPGVEAAGGFDLSKKEARLIDHGEGKIGFCTMRDVGNFMVAALQHPDASFGKALKVQSFVVKAKDVLKEYEKQTGATWSSSSISLEALKKWEDELWANGNGGAGTVSLRRIWAEGGTLYEKNDNDLIGANPQILDTLESAVARLLSEGKSL